jgi:hypothetical protein
MRMLGFLAFIVGFILAIVAGLFFPDKSWVYYILIILGLLIGFLNIADKEVMLFLLAAVALIVAGAVFAPITTLGIGEKLDNIMSLIATLMAPAALVVAIKALWQAAKPE